MSSYFSDKSDDVGHTSITSINIQSSHTSQLHDEILPDSAMNLDLHSDSIGNLSSPFFGSPLHTQKNSQYMDTDRALNAHAELLSRNHFDARLPSSSYPLSNTIESKSEQVINNSLPIMVPSSLPRMARNNLSSRNPSSVSSPLLSSANSTYYNSQSLFPSNMYYNQPMEESRITQIERPSLSPAEVELPQAASPTYKKRKQPSRKKSEDVPIGSTHKRQDSPKSPISAKNTAAHSRPRRTAESASSPRATKLSSNLSKHSSMNERSSSLAVGIRHSNSAISSTNVLTSHSSRKTANALPSKSTLSKSGNYLDTGFHSSQMPPTLASNFPTVHAQSLNITETTSLTGHRSSFSLHPSLVIPSVPHSSNTESSKGKYSPRKSSQSSNAMMIDPPIKGNHTLKVTSRGDHTSSSMQGTNDIHAAPSSIQGSSPTSHRMTVSNASSNTMTGLNAGSIPVLASKPWTDRDKQSTKLWVNFLPLNWSEEVIRSELQSLLTPNGVGSLIITKVALHPQSSSESMNKRLATIYLATREDCEAAMQILRHCKIQGKVLSISFNEPIRQPDSDESLASTKTLFVANVHLGATEDQIRMLFLQFGQIISAVMVRNQHSKVSRGFVFVEYAEHASCELALRYMQNEVFCGQPLKIKIAKAHATIHKPINHTMVPPSSLIPAAGFNSSMPLSPCIPTILTSTASKTTSSSGNSASSSTIAMTSSSSSLSPNVPASPSYASSSSTSTTTMASSMEASPSSSPPSSTSNYNSKSQVAQSPLSPSSNISASISSNKISILPSPFSNQLPKSSAPLSTSSSEGQQSIKMETSTPAAQANPLHVATVLPTTYNHEEHIHSKFNHVQSEKPQGRSIPIPVIATSQTPTDLPSSTRFSPPNILPITTMKLSSQEDCVIASPVMKILPKALPTISQPSQPLSTTFDPISASTASRLSEEPSTKQPMAVSIPNATDFLQAEPATPVFSTVAHDASLIRSTVVTKPSIESKRVNRPSRAETDIKVTSSPKVLSASTPSSENANDRSTPSRMTRSKANAAKRAAAAAASQQQRHSHSVLSGFKLGSSTGSLAKQHLPDEDPSQQKSKKKTAPPRSKKAGAGSGLSVDIPIDHHSSSQAMTHPVQQAHMANMHILIPQNFSHTQMPPHHHQQLQHDETQSHSVPYQSNSAPLQHTQPLHHHHHPGSLDLHGYMPNLAYSEPQSHILQSPPHHTHLHHGNSVHTHNSGTHNSFHEFTTTAPLSPPIQFVPTLFSESTSDFHQDNRWHAASIPHTSSPSHDMHFPNLVNTFSTIPGGDSSGPLSPRVSFLDV